jgi:hypothetical protein
MSAINEYEVQWRMKNYKEHMWNSHNVRGKEVKELIEIWCIYECTSLLTRPFSLSEGKHDLVTSGHS